jgi:prevent-host-death family protein
MGATISQRELRNDSGAIMRRVEQGESFVVTRNGVPVADLLPHDASRTRGPQRFVPVDTIADGVAEMAIWGIDRFQREFAELDELLDDRDVDRWSSGS